jgi:hypothetical protein
VVQAVVLMVPMAVNREVLLAVHHHLNVVQMMELQNLYLMLLLVMITLIDLPLAFQLLVPQLFVFCERRREN